MYEQLKERALVNFEILLDKWNIEYKKINDYEYDFINPTREDHNFGACRFNIQKNKGCDFAGISYNEQDFLKVGKGFSKDDFAELGAKGNVSTNYGFDIIGLCQRLHNLTSRQKAVDKLKNDLNLLSKAEGYESVNKEKVKERIEEREKLGQINALKKLKQAQKIWSICTYYKETLGETYLKSRKIYIENQKSIKFHFKVYNSETKEFLPALLFKVSQSPDSPLQAIHRIYLNRDGNNKANINEPKVALGLIKNGGIWFGEKDKTLLIAEGPENALSLLGYYKFVVSTVYSTNFHNLIIPDYVDNLILCPDNDKAGQASVIRAVKSYQLQGKKLKISFPPKRDNNPKFDWNDLLIEAYLNGTEEK